MWGALKKCCSQTLTTGHRQREEGRSRKRTFQAEWTRQSPEEARSAAVGGSGGLNSWNLTMGGPAWRWHAGQGLWAQVSSLSLTP